MKRRKLFSALTSAAICLSLLSGQTATQATTAETDGVPLGYDITAHKKRRSHHEM